MEEQQQEQVVEPKKSQRYAVVVGVNDYNSTPLSDLTYCSADAEAFYDALLNYSLYEKDNIVLFSDGEHSDARSPSYSDILSSLRHFSSKAEEDDSVLFFFAGHGTHDEADSYLLTKDYRENVLSDSSMALSKVDDYLRGSKAKFVMRFFDACHSGRMGRRDDSAQAAGPNLEQLLTVQAEGWATFAACKVDEFAYEPEELGHGIFSFFLVRGLEGAAAKNDGIVTLDGLKIYVMDNVNEMARKRGIHQTPVFKGDQAGQLVMSYAKSDPLSTSEKLPVTLQRIADVHIEELAPKVDDVQPLLVELRNALTAETIVKKYVAVSQDDKLDEIAKTAQLSLEWLQEQADIANKTLQHQGVFSADIVNIAKAPLNKSLCQDLFNFKGRDTIEWTINTEKVIRNQGSANGLSTIAAALGRPMGQEYDTFSSYVTQNDLPESTVVLHFSPAGHTVPHCAMVMCVIPSAVGCFVYCYFASTRMAKKMEENWEKNSFSRRFFYPCQMGREPFDSFSAELDKTFAEFMSFIVSSAKSRQATFETMGIPNNEDEDTD